MANQESVNQRPKCEYKVATPTGRVPCGSENQIFDVKGRGRYGGVKDTPVCAKHLPEAWKTWNVDSAQPCGTTK